MMPSVRLARLLGAAPLFRGCNNILSIKREGIYRPPTIPGFSLARASPACISHAGAAVSFLFIKRRETESY